MQNVMWSLRLQARKKKCKAFYENIRFKYPFDNDYVYPDVLYTCNPKDLSDGTTIHFPSLIVEVLSSSTENYDRGTKRDNYFRCPSLQCYLIVYQQIERVECYERANDFWKYRNFENINDSFTIDSLELTISLSDFYEDINIPEADRQAYIAQSVPFTFKD
jgi:Uma2 family endonuclease